MIWALYLAIPDNGYSEWEVLGMFSSNEKAAHAKALFLQDAAERVLYDKEFIDRRYECGGRSMAATT